MKQLVWMEKIIAALTATATATASASSETDTARLLLLPPSLL
jgi:hypothetical protein